VDLPYGKQEITVNLAAAGALYDKLRDETEGYTANVPVIHKAVAVKAAIDALDMAFQEDRDANLAGEWPERPSLRFLVYWSLRRDQLCEPNLCPDAPEEHGRCDACPLHRLDEAENSESGRLLQRALDLRAASRMGIQLRLDDVAADELQAMLILDEERDTCAREREQL
jgi:hypothetical protein